MSTETQNPSDEQEKVRHSAFEEFSRDERRPAVLLLAGLIIAAIFFALGILFGRWTEKQPRPAITAPTNQQGANVPVNRQIPTPSPSASPSLDTSPEPARRTTR